MNAKGHFTGILGCARRSRRKGAILAALLVAIQTLGLGLPSGAADSTSLAGTLSPPRSDAVVVWDGAHFYVLGGQCFGFGPTATCTAATVHLDEIVRYDPVSGASALVGALPVGRSQMSGVWTGAEAFLFGGWSPGPGRVAEILRFTPPGAVVALDAATAKLPTGRVGTAAVWDQARGVAYVFGGFDGARLAQILRFDPMAPAGAQVTVLPDTLPTPTDDMAAVWDPVAGVAYLFGGRDDAGLATDRIVRFDPAAAAGSRVAVLGDVDPAMKLPSPRFAAAAVWNDDEGVAYVFGGTGAPYSAEIVRFDPAPVASPVTLMRATLPSGRASAAAGWDGAGAFVFGGYDGVTTLGDVVRYADTPGRPRDVVATAGPSGGQITLAWTAPGFDTHTSPVTAYRVLRSDTAEGAAVVVAEVAGDVSTFTDSGLPDETTRFYRVVAVNAHGESAPSGQVSATTFGRPCEPMLLTARRGPGVGEITLEWQPPLCGGGTAITGYNVVRSSTSGGPYALHAQLGAVLTFTDAGLSNGQFWCYRVHAVNSVGEGPPGNEACARSPSRPTPPQNLNAAPGGDSVLLTWTDPADDGGIARTKFRIHRASAAGGPYSPIAEVPPSEHSYNDYTCAAGATCHYVVTAWNLIGESGHSNSDSEVGTATFVLRETFDGLQGVQGWSFGGLWRVSECRSLSAPRSIGYHQNMACPANFDLGGRTTGTAITPHRLLPVNKARVHLAYASWFDTDFGCGDDMKKVRIREVDAVGLNPGPWTDLVWCEQGVPLPVVGELQEIWYSRVVSIPNAWWGKWVQIGFEFDSMNGNNNGGEGWHVDEVAILTD